jgi:ribose transport system substrate-binding protein
MKKWLAALVGLFLMVGVRAENIPPSQITIALIPGLTTDPFYITMHEGAAYAAKLMGVHLIWAGGQSFSPTSQIPVLNAIIARHPNVILIAPTDAQALIAPLRKAYEAGIKIITVDTYIGNGVYQNGGPAGFPLSYIASDNIEGGRIAAEALAKAIGYKGEVYVENVEPGISTTDQRQEGFLEQMKQYPGIKVLPTQYCNDSATKAAEQLAAVYAAHPYLKGVFGANIFSALGAAKGVQNVKAQGKIIVEGFDAEPALVQAVQQGIVGMLIAQQPWDIGYYGVVSVVAAVEGHPIPVRIKTGFTVITRQNLNTPQAQQAIYSTTYQAP